VAILHQTISRLQQHILDAVRLLSCDSLSFSLSLSFPSRPTDSDLVHRASLCPGGRQSHLHLPGSSQPSYYGLQVCLHTHKTFSFTFWFKGGVRFLKLCVTLEPPVGPKAAWCCRAPGRACSPPRPTTPSSPSPSPVSSSTPWERPTSASWWTSTVSHTTLIPFSGHGPRYSLQSGVGRMKHTHTKTPLSLSLCLSLSSSVSLSPVGPILLVEPLPKTVDVDSDVTLNCKWAGNPPLTLTWFKKGSNMVSSSRFPLFLYSHYISAVHSSPVFTNAFARRLSSLCCCCCCVIYSVNHLQYNMIIYNIENRKTEKAYAEATMLI